MLHLLPLAALPLAALALTRSLKGQDLSCYDTDRPIDFHVDPTSDHLNAMRAFLFDTIEKPATNRGREAIASKRKRFEDMGFNRVFPSTFTPLQIGNMSGEWVRAKNADPDRRLLYLHGGAFTVGSAVSHRSITSKLAEATGASVCAVNYRLMPENTRKDALADSRSAYEYLLMNGPDGPRPMKSLALGGDSAGGNLTLSLLNWVRDQGLAPVNAAFAISPQTDSTFITPGIEENIATDDMLRPMVKPLMNIPRALILYMTWKTTGFKPNAPEISPIRADLNALPPTLIHASRQEMLYYDALRYFNKSKLTGNDVELQIWEHVPHAWHIFDDTLPEANHAMDEIVKFLNKYGF